jgi:hypothetical protein
MVVLKFHSNVWYVKMLKNGENKGKNDDFAYLRQKWKERQAVGAMSDCGL